MEKREPSYIVGGNVNWYRHFGKQYGDSSRAAAGRRHLKPEARAGCQEEQPEELWLRRRRRA